LDYTAGSGSWHAGLFVNNLTNNEVIAQDYVASVLFGSPVVGVLTPPRTYGVRAGVSF
jgi:outer membrane receptor protein involved in Fe transport